MEPVVVAVHRSAQHTFSKDSVASIRLLEGIGVEGDVHSGATVTHRSHVARDRERPNLRQVHLIHEELFELLGRDGFTVAPGQLGENITTRGLDVLSLPVGTRLTVGDAVVTLTGLRNPCRQINDFQAGLLKQVLRRGEDGSVQNLAGVMGVVSLGGAVRAADTIEVELPPGPHVPLTPV